MQDKEEKKKDSRKKMDEQTLLERLEKEREKVRELVKSFVGNPDNPANIQAANEFLDYIAGQFCETQPSDPNDALEVRRAELNIVYQAGLKSVETVTAKISLYDIRVESEMRLLSGRR